MTRRKQSRSLIERLENRTLLSGVLDPSFGVDGMVKTDMWFQDSAVAVAVQPNTNKIVVAGKTGIARYNVNGSLDPTFDGDGKVLFNDGFFWGSWGVDIAIQADSKIVVAGSTYDYTATSNYAVAVARYNPNGTLDGSFGNGGRVTTHVGLFDDAANSVVLQSDGKIVVGGMAESRPIESHWSDPNNTDFALVRYNADGTLDDSFGAGGRVVTAFGATDTIDNPSTDIINDLVVQMVDGEEHIVAAGRAHTDFALARYRPDGSLDPTFGTAGMTRTNFGFDTLGPLDEPYTRDLAHAVAIQQHPIHGERIIAGGLSSVEEELAGNEGERAGIAAYTADGLLDPTFGTGGMLTNQLIDEVNDLAVQDDGKILIVGHSWSGPYDADFGTVRYNAEGSLDDGSSSDSTPNDSFGSGGKVSTNFPKSSYPWYDDEEAYAITIQPDGKIVVVGQSEDDYAVARYFSDEPPIAFSINDVSVTEGDSATVDAVFTVSLSAPSDQPLTVDYFTANDSARSGSDYTAVSGTLTFNPGELTRTISVPIAGETMYETDEVFAMNLRHSTVAALSDPRGVATIVNDDARPRMSISDVTRREMNSGSNRIAFTFTVSLSNASSEVIGVNYRTADGMATAGGDYEAASGTLHFYSGETSKTVTVWVIGDKVKEADETFFLDLWGARNVEVLDDRGVGTILNDDR